MKEQKQFDDSKYRWDIDGIKWIKYFWLAALVLGFGFLVVLTLCE